MAVRHTAALALAGLVLGGAPALAGDVASSVSLRSQSQAIGQAIGTQMQGRLTVAPSPSAPQTVTNPQEAPRYAAPGPEVLIPPGYPAPDR